MRTSRDKSAVDLTYRLIVWAHRNKNRRHSRWSVESHLINIQVQANIHAQANNENDMGMDNTFLVVG